MVSSRQKGIRAERQIIEILSRETGLHWEQTPGSGSGKVKGDLRVHGKHNLFHFTFKGTVFSYFPC